MGIGLTHGISLMPMDVYCAKRSILIHKEMVYEMLDLSYALIFMNYGIGI